MNKLKNNIINFDDYYPQVNKLIVWAFALYIGIWFLQIGERRAIFGAIRFEFLLGAFLIVSAMVVLFTIRSNYQENHQLGLPVIVFFLILILYVMWSHDVDKSWETFWNRLFKFSCMALFISTFIRHPKHLKIVLFALLLTFSYLAVESFRNALNGSMVWYNQGVPRLHGVTSLFSHPNSLAGLAMGMLPFAWFLFPVYKSIWMRGMLVVMGLASLGCVLYSGSRTSYVGLMVFLLFLVWVSKRKLSLILFLLMLFFIGLPFVPTEYRARFNTMVTGVEIEGGSMGARKEIMSDAFDVIKQYPLGVGVSAFPTVRRALFGRHQDTHNLYLEVATNLGIPGLLVFFWLIFKLMRSLKKTRTSFEKQLKQMNKKNDEIPRYATAPDGFDDHLFHLKLGRALALCISGYIFIRLALGMFGMDLYEIYWWIGIGFAVSLFNIEQSARQLTDKMTQFHYEGRELIWKK